MRTRQLKSALGLAAVLALSAVSGANVVINMPAPPKLKPEPKVVVVPAPNIGGRPETIEVTDGQIALHRYAWVRSEPYDTYWPVYGPGYHYNYSTYWPYWPWFGGSFFFGHVHCHSHGFCR